MNSEVTAPAKATESNSPVEQTPHEKMDYQAFKRARETKSQPAAEVASETTVVSEAADKNETEELSGQDSAAESEVEAEGQETSDENQKKRKNSNARKLAKLRGEVAAKNQELEFLRAELSKGRPQNSESPDPALKAIKEDGKPKKDDFESHDEYVEALTDWKVQSAFKVEKSETIKVQAKSEEQRRSEAHAERVTKFVESKPDFNDVVQALDDSQPVSLTVREVILSSDNGPELMYELAKNRKEYERINALSPIAAARELGKFEAKLIKPSEAKVETKTTRAPAPVTPVSSKSTGQTKDPDKMSFSEYKAWRERSSRKA